jgi:hypothetical protein
MNTSLNSRERLLRAISNQDVDTIPCSFMSFAILRKQKMKIYAQSPWRKSDGADPMHSSGRRTSRREHPDLRAVCRSALDRK